LCCVLFALLGLLRRIVCDSVVLSRSLLVDQVILRLVSIVASNLAIDNRPRIYVR